MLDVSVARVAFFLKKISRGAEAEVLEVVKVFHTHVQ